MWKCITQAEIDAALKRVQDAKPAEPITGWHLQVKAADFWGNAQVVEIVLVCKGVNGSVMSVESIYKIYGGI